MKFDTPLHKAQGAGSAKSGSQHWLLQRITALALVPLGLWFVGAFIVFLAAPFDVVYDWLSSPWTATISILFMAISLYHGALGMQVIWEDYISSESIRRILVISTYFISILMGLLASISILKVYLS